MFRGDFVSRRLPCRSGASLGNPDRMVSVVILAAAFSLGMLIGFLFGALIPAGEGLSEYLAGYFSSVGQGSLSLSFLSVAWELLRWILFAFVLSFSRLGLIGLPVLLLARGFMLSHAVSVFVRTLGGCGLWMALAVFGVTAVLVIPALFALCCDGHSALRQHNAASFSAERMMLWSVCAGFLATAIAVQWTLTPIVVSALSKRFF